MSQKNQNMVQESTVETQDTAFNPLEDMQVVMQGGVPVSVIIPTEEFDRMSATIDLAEELLEGKDLFLPDGTKVTFQEMIDHRVAQEHAEYEAELAAMFEDTECDEDCDEDCGQEEDEEQA
jgi:hypothetical protein